MVAIFQVSTLITLSLAYPAVSLLTQQSVEPFDPNDCYEAGTIFEENEKNLGFCPCKYGYYGPLCFEIWDCAIGELRTDTCDKDFGNDFDLQWRCAASKKDVVKICTCPEGFRGETCEFILENTFATYWETAKQSQRFFEIVYNRSHSVARLVVSAVSRKILEYRRLIMLIIFCIIFQMAWMRVRREKKESKLLNCPSNHRNSREQELKKIEKLETCIPIEDSELKNSVRAEDVAWNSKKYFDKSAETTILMCEKEVLLPYETLRRMDSQETYLTNSSSSASSLRTEETENEENLMKELNGTASEATTESNRSNDFRVHKPCLHI